VEPLLETIELASDESNELLFKVKVEGLDQAPTKIRLVCEAGDISYMFNGYPAGDDVVQFIIPAMNDKVLKEETLLSRVEVLIENRYFSPVQFQLRFKQPVRVVAEAIRMPARPVQPQVKVTATPIVVKKPVAPPPPAPVPVRAQAPVQTRQAQQQTSTLKERYVTKAPRQVVETIDDASEDLIRELARGFVKGKK